MTLRKLITSIPASMRSAAGGICAVVLLTVATPAITAYADEPAPEHSTARFETHFLREMIDHHHMAVMMAETCLMKALHEPLLTMCASIQTTQQMEIAMLQSWLADWYGINHEPQMRRSDMREMESLAALPPEEYEVAFMNSMISHHLQALESSSSCLVRAGHGELIGMCADIIAAQAKEIETLRDWLCKWYDVCHLRHDHRGRH